MRQVSTLHVGHPGTEAGSFLLGTIGCSEVSGVSVVQD